MAQQEALDLSAFGFLYDPFSDLDAVRDPHLIQHLVVPRTVMQLVREIPTAFLAAPGGGKSALRLFTEQSLVDMSELSFIITYLLDPDEVFPNLPSFGDHEQRLVANAAADILRGFLTNPQRFLRLERPQRARVAALLNAYLKIDLGYLVEILKTSPAQQAQTVVLEMLGRAFSHKPFARGGDLQHLGRALELELARSAGMPRVSFDELAALIFEIFEAREIFILMDGIDAAPQTIHNPELAAGWILPLLAQAEGLARRRIFLKAFLTTEIEPYLLAAFPGGRLPIPVVRLQWDRPLLSSMLRRRTHLASGEKFGSLDGVGAAYLRDMEDTIVDRLPASYRLPREALWLTRQIFIEALKRDHHGEPPQIQQSDLDAAFAWYARQPNRALPDAAAFERVEPS